MHSPSTIMLPYILLLLLISVVPFCYCTCECGYSITDPNDENQQYIFTEMLETDFTKMTDMEQNSDWTRMAFNVSAEAGRGEYGKMFTTANVDVNREGSEEGSEAPETAVTAVELRVDHELIEGHVPGAEIDSARLDVHWGSFRAGMRTTGQNGTCAAFFWYYNDTQEIDMELLSREFIPDENYYPLSLVIQSKESKEAGYDASKTGTYQKINLMFNPAEDFHEYRFDYVPGKVLFYVDSELQAEMAGDEVPSVGGHLILQHWSNGNPKWSGGPPVDDAVMSISYVKVYFNSSDPEQMLKKVDQCNLTRSAGAAEASVCAIPDGSQDTARNGTHFFSDADYVTDGLEGSTGDGKPQTPEPGRDTPGSDTKTEEGEQESLDNAHDDEDKAASLGRGQPMALAMALIGTMCLVQT